MLHVFGQATFYLHTHPIFFPLQMEVICWRRVYKGLCVCSFHIFIKLFSHSSWTKTHCWSFCVCRRSCSSRPHLRWQLNSRQLIIISVFTSQNNLQHISSLLFLLFKRKLSSLTLSLIHFTSAWCVKLAAPPKTFFSFYYRKHSRDQT